jgi:hypothetical protein
MFYHLLKEIVSSGGSYGGLLFLSPQILLLPKVEAGVFEFWKVPSTPDTAPTHPIAALGLPILKEGHLISMLSCRGEPNPAGGGLPYSTQPYNSSPMDAIIIFNLRVQGVGVVITGNTFSIFVHRRALLELCQDTTISPPQSDDDDTPVIPWRRWGPAITRWLGTGVMPTRWITTTSGQRCVFRLAGTGDELSPIVVLDFNPTSVKRAAVGILSVVKLQSKIVHRAFKMPIISNLPYVCFASPDVFNYDGILMDEERLIGLQVRSSLRFHSFHTYLSPVRLIS